MMSCRSSKLGFMPTIAFIVLGVGTAQADEESISRNMAECAGMLMAAADWVGESDRVEQFSDMSRMWAMAGTAQARDEGHFYPDYFVEVTFMAAYEDWRRRGATATESEDFLSLADYCRSIADTRGLDFYAG